MFKFWKPLSGIMLRTYNSTSFSAPPIISSVTLFQVSSGKLLRLSNGSFMRVK